MLLNFDKFLKYLITEKNRQPRTIEAYQFELSRFQSYLDKSWQDITKQDIRNYLDSLANTNSASARARSLSSIKSFFNYLVREGHIINNPTDGIDAPKIPKKEPKPLSVEECTKLISVIKEFSNGHKTCMRDIAIIQMFLNTGIRLSELCNLTRENVNLEQRAIKIIRKGGNEQTIPLNSQITAILRKYESRQIEQDGFYFLSNRKRQLHPNTVQKMVEKYLFFADIKNHSVHSLRHTFATILAKQHPLQIVQDLMGHKNPQTTIRYIKIAEQDRQTAVESIRIGR